ncbi:hypothetical protein [Burkholderia sp. WAC0059]|uniref:hypothetical protein n=1 Tax=Burkholderia sp. WAC0059 TaxID=2066022 RepID=UPI0011AED9F4|nr:hypothetical protein [Burkholderia sp. WAC0059]
MAIPTAEDWGSLCRDLSPELVAKANGILVQVLRDLNSPPHSDHVQTWSDVAKAVYRPLIDLANEYDTDLLDSEGTPAAALFFALNHDVCLYHFLRYSGVSHAQAME